MRNTRTIVAVTLLATALCADQRMLSAPRVSGEQTQVTGGFARRLTVALHRAVRSARWHQPHERAVDGSIRPATFAMKAQVSEPDRPATLLQSYLPPPPL